MVPQPPGSRRNLLLCFILGGRGGGRRAEGKEHLSSASRLKPQWNVFPCSVTYSVSLCVLRLAQEAHRNIQGAGDHLHLAADTGSELLETSWASSRVGTENGHRHCHCPLTFSQQSQTEEEFFFSPRKYWHSSKHRGTRWSRNTAKIRG